MIRSGRLRPREESHMRMNCWWSRWSGRRHRDLPGLIIPGAMKAGTTSLFRHMEGHPQLAPAPHKEVHYFDHHFHRGPAWYRRQFTAPPRTASGMRLIACESSPYYMFEPRVPGRLRDLVPDVKLVFLLRDPVERAFSHYHNNRRLGRESLDFESALDAEDDRTLAEEDRLHADPMHVSKPHRLYSYRRRGLYAEQLLRWQACFPADQMLVVDSRRLFTDSAAVVAEVLRFVGVAPWQPRSFAARNEGRHGDAMSPRARGKLEAFFAPHEERLRRLIGWCPSHRSQAGARRAA